MRKEDCSRKVVVSNSRSPLLWSDRSGNWGRRQENHSCSISNSRHRRSLKGIAKVFQKSFSFNHSNHSRHRRQECPSPGNDHDDDLDKCCDEAPCFLTMSKTCSHKKKVNVTIPLVVGQEAFMLTEDRVASMLAKTRYIQRHNAICKVPFLERDDVEIGEFIAEGGFANIHRVETWHGDWHDTHNPYVLKTIKAEQYSSAERISNAAADLMMEAIVLSALNHPHILQLRGISSGGAASLKHGRVDGLFLVLECLPCTLHQRLIDWQESPNPASSLGDRWQSAMQLASALQYLHAKNILYRDLKPSNIGFDAQGHLKLFDFGLAIEIPGSRDPNKRYQLCGRKGTARYMAPEVCRRNKPYNAKADVFSYCILLWQLLTLEKPFYNISSHEDILQEIIRGERPSINSLPALPTEAATASVQRLLGQGWSKDIEKRPTMKEICQLLIDLQDQVVPSSHSTSEGAWLDRENSCNSCCLGNDSSGCLESERSHLTSKVDDGDNNLTNLNMDSHPTRSGDAEILCYY